MKMPHWLEYFAGSLAAITVSLVAPAILTLPTAAAQNPQLQEHVAGITQSMAQNKRALAQYTWQELETISIKGEVRKQGLFQVRIGPEGKPQKSEIGPEDQSSGRRRRGLRNKIKEGMTQEYEDYGKQIAGLAREYMQQEPGRLQQLFEQGNITLGSRGAPGNVHVVIQNYVKSGDSVIIIFNKPQRAIQNIQVSSYLSNPSDGVKISAQFARLPQGPNHVYDLLVIGTSKHLAVEMQNSNYVARAFSERAPLKE